MASVCPLSIFSTRNSFSFIVLGSARYCQQEASTTEPALPLAFYRRALRPVLLGRSATERDPLRLPDNSRARFCGVIFEGGEK